MIKPKKLQKGDTIGIIGCAGFATPDLIEKGTKILAEMGYKVKIGKSCGKTWYSFSGEDQLRADDINNMFADKNIDAVMCMRGGYGCNRLIDLIDFEIIKGNPKLFIGYSDVTTLHCAIEQYANMVTIHGPMLIPNFANIPQEVHADGVLKINNRSAATLSSLNADNKGVSYDLGKYNNKNCELNGYNFTKESFLNIVEGKAEFLNNPSTEKIKTLIPGICTGKLAGGNLELASNTLGTNYALNSKGKILFLEDVNEYTYKVDKMMYHMKHCNVFKECVGVIFGDFKNCGKEKPCDFEILEQLKLFFKEL